PPRPTPNPLVGPIITANRSCCFLHSLKYLTRSTSFPHAGRTFIGINFSLHCLVASLAAFVNSLMR
ncbi:hypothetical protein K443DRAFT_31325, partial [Laccaria amethystina LaAM-08-1]